MFRSFAQRASRHGYRCLIVRETLQSPAADHGWRTETMSFGLWGYRVSPAALFLLIPGLRWSRSTVNGDQAVV